MTQQKAANSEYTPLNVTFFPKCYKPDDATIKPISDVLRSIKEGEWQHLITELNKLEGTAQDKFKKKQLPAVAFNGEFSRRANDALVQHNGLFTGDYDHVNGAELKEKIKKLPFVYCAFLSPRGGLKVISRGQVVNNDTDYKKVLAEINKALREVAPVKEDKSCKDVSRLTFVSYDPELYINEECVPFPEVQFTVEKTKEETKEQITEAQEESKDLMTINSFNKQNLRIASWVEDFLLNYCLTNKLPSGGRHHYIEKNLVAFAHNREDWEQIKKQYIEVQRGGVDTLKTWENRIKKGDFAKVSPGELANFIKEEKTVQYTPLPNSMFSLGMEEVTELPKDIEFHNAKNMLSKPAPEINYIVEPLIPFPGVTVIGGEPKGGKSIFASQLCICAAAGFQFLNEYITKKVKILYVDSENGTATTHRRFEAICNQLDINSNLLDQIELTFFPKLLLDAEGGKEALQTMVKKVKPQLVVLDSLTRFLSGDENSSKDMRKVFENIREVVHNPENPCSIIVLHHMAKSKNGKASISSLRGSGDFGAMADTVLTLNKRKKYVAFNCVAHRHRATHDLEKLRMTFESCDGLAFYLMEGKEESRDQKCQDDIVEFLNGKGLVARKEIEKELIGDYARSYIDKVLKSLIENKVVNNPKRGFYELTLEVEHETV